MQFCSVFNTNPTFTTVKVSGLTPTHVVYAGAAGLLSGSANLVFDGTNLTCLGNMGIGIGAGSAQGVTVEFNAAALGTARGIYGGVISTRNTPGGSLVSGLIFQARWEPTSLAATRTFATFQGAQAGISATSPTGTYGLTITSGYCFRPIITLVSGGTGTVSISTLYQFSAVASTLTPGAGSATIGTQYAFYDPGLTQATTNWGLAINTQSYINAALSIGKNTAPTASNLNLSATYNIEKDTNDLTITTASQKTIVLSQAVYKDINIAGSLLGKPASAAPGTDSFRSDGGTDTTILTNAFAIDEYVSGGFELQHDYKEGTDLVFHVHWQGIAAPTGGTDNVQWRLTYIVARDGVTLAAATTIDSPDTAITVQYRCYRTDFGAITGTTFKIGDQFMFNLYRVAAGSDDYSGDCLIETAGIHYQCDTIGSRQIGTK